MKSKVFLIKTKGKVFLVETINETNVKIAPKDYSKVKTNVKSEGSDYSDDGNEKKQDPRGVHFGAVDAEVRGEVKTSHALSLSLSLSSRNATVAKLTPRVKVWGLGLLVTMIGEGKKC